MQCPFITWRLRRAVKCSNNWSGTLGSLKYQIPFFREEKTWIHGFLRQILDMPSKKTQRDRGGRSKLRKRIFLLSLCCWGTQSSERQGASQTCTAALWWSENSNTDLIPKPTVIPYITSAWKYRCRPWEQNRGWGLEKWFLLFQFSKSHYPGLLKLDDFKLLTFSCV